MNETQEVDMSTKEAQAIAFNNEIAPCNAIKLINNLRARIESLEKSVY